MQWNQLLKLQQLISWPSFKRSKRQGDGRDTDPQICILTRICLFTNRLQFVGDCQETIPEVQPEAKQEQQEGGSSGSQCLNPTK